jgi:hypothetical protein
LRALAVMELDGFEIRTRVRHGEEHSEMELTEGWAEMSTLFMFRPRLGWCDVESPYQRDIRSDKRLSNHRRYTRRQTVDNQ